ncbi:hypothetical protein DPMN_155638 [Dreissena polymorpha]|uniref:Uncharacterized protein n=1 Tax=Dreissena polymorpha TaxID=45954 RepID=A0A9D4FRK6_DREPO|nr:hypothetical protein DPMN_155638 [Dreissena polymorpha]
MMTRECYLSPIERIIDHISDRIVPLSMKANMVLLDALLNNTSSSKKIVANFSPVRTSVQEHIVNVRLFHVKFQAKDTFSVTKIVNLAKVSCGHCSDVYSAKYMESDISIRVVNARSCNRLSHIDHLEMLRFVTTCYYTLYIYFFNTFCEQGKLLNNNTTFRRRLQHEHMVRFIEVCYTDWLPGHVEIRDADLGSFRLMFMFERCDYTLQDYIFGTP